MMSHARSPPLQMGATFREGDHDAARSHEPSDSGPFDVEDTGADDDDGGAAS